MRDAGEAGTEPGSLAVTTNGDALRLPFPDDTFDRIIASEVLEHVPDDQAALDELFRVLKPGGTLAVTVPAWLPEKICWALSRRVPRPVRARAATSASTRADAAGPHAHGRPASRAPPTTPTRCTRRTGG